MQAMRDFSFLLLFIIIPLISYRAISKFIVKGYIPELTFISLTTGITLFFIFLRDPLKTNPIKQEPPDYPRRSLELGISGTTLLKIRVKKDGTVGNTEQ